jgi:hypothetical protein
MMLYELGVLWTLVGFMERKVVMFFSIQLPMENI